MHSPGINGEGELKGQPANPGSPGKKAVKMECVYLTFRGMQTFLGQLLLHLFQISLTS